MLETLGASLPLLMDVVLFMLWFVVAMTVMGVMFFGGTMTDRVFSRAAPPRRRSSTTLSSRRAAPRGRRRSST